jgi:hypothetical protein
MPAPGSASKRASTSSATWPYTDGLDDKRSIQVSEPISSVILPPLELDYPDHKRAVTTVALTTVTVVVPTNRTITFTETATASGWFISPTPSPSEETATPSESTDTVTALLTAAKSDTFAANSATDLPINATSILTIAIGNNSNPMPTGKTITLGGPSGGFMSVLNGTGFISPTLSTASSTGDMQGNGKAGTTDNAVSTTSKNGAPVETGAVDR